MKKNALVSLLILIASSTCELAAQTTSVTYDRDKKFQVTQLQKDFVAFRKSLEEAQASLYRYAPKRKVDQKFDAAFAAISRDMTEREYYGILTEVLSEIKDGHSNSFVTRDFRNYINLIAKMLPIKLRFINGRAYVMSSPLPQVIPGSEIRSINGRQMSQVVRELFAHLTSDGEIQTGKFWKLNEQFALYYYLFIGQPANFDIVCFNPSNKTRQPIEIPALTQTEQKEMLKGKGSSPDVEKKPLRFEPLAIPKTALLTIETFDDGAIEKAGQNFQQFLKSAFQQIAEQDIQDLIIDLRGNDGGADFGPLLFSYLTNTEFRFADRIEAATAKPSFILNYTNVGPDFLKRLAESLVPDGKRRYRVKTESEPTLSMQQPQPNSYLNRVWFMANGETFSATAMFCDIARSHRRGAFVGEETGGDYYGNSAGEFVVITLAETKIKIIVALEEYWTAVSKGPPAGRGIIPVYPVRPSVGDVLENKDSELNHTLDSIKRQRAK